MQTTHFSAPLVRSASTVSCQQWKAGSWNVIYFLESHSRVSIIGAHFRTKDKGEFLSKWLFLNSFIFDTHNETPICLQAAGSLFPVLCTVDLSTSLKEQLQTSQKLASASSRRTVSIGTQLSDDFSITICLFPFQGSEKLKKRFAFLRVTQSIRIFGECPFNNRTISDQWDYDV